MLVWFRPGNTSGSGKFLRAKSTTLDEKFSRGTLLIAVPNGKNDLDWAIRLRDSKCAID